MLFRSVILGGLLSSTVLNVFVVPVLYRFIATRYRNRLRASVDEGQSLAE